MNPSIIIPTLWRVKQLAALLDNIRQTTSRPMSHAHPDQWAYEVVVVSEDAETADYIHNEAEGLVTFVEVGGTPVEKWNRGAAEANGDWLVLVGDDCMFKPGWLDEIERTPNAGFVGLNEGVAWTEDVGHYAISRDFACDVLGGVLASPCYKSWSFDQEVCALARKAGRYAKTRAVVFEHNHYSLGKARFDATYERALGWHVEDACTFVERKAQGFPITWEPLWQKSPQ